MDQTAWLHEQTPKPLTQSPKAFKGTFRPVMRVQLRATVVFRRYNRVDGRSTAAQH